jgi:hypothetical protein
MELFRRLYSLQVVIINHNCVISFHFNSQHNVYTFSSSKIFYASSIYLHQSSGKCLTVIEMLMLNVNAIHFFTMVQRTKREMKYS